MITKDFYFKITILPVFEAKTHIRSVRGSNPCTATNHFKKLAPESHGANVVQAKKSCPPESNPPKTPISQKVLRTNLKGNSYSSDLCPIPLLRTHQVCILSLFRGHRPSFESSFRGVVPPLITSSSGRFPLIVQIPTW